MKIPVRWQTAPGCLALAAALIISAGCASTSPQPTASAKPAPAVAAGGIARQTPASVGSLVDSANLTAQAEREGYRPEVHDGAVIYCWTDAETGSSIPTKKCVNQDQMREMLLQSQQQREDMRRNQASSTQCVAVAC